MSEKIILATEQLRADLATMALAHPPERAAQLLPEFLQRSGASLGADRCAWFAVPAGDDNATCTHEWRSDKVEPGVGAKYARTEMPELWKRMEAGKTAFVRVADADDAPFADLRAVLREENLAGFIVVPVIHDGRLVGCLGYDFVSVPNPPDDGFLASLARLADAVHRVIARQTEAEQRSELESRLRQKQKLETLGVLAGGIAHDFNNMLQIISVYASFLRLPGTEKEKTDAIGHIDNAVDRSSQLTRKLLVFAQQEPGSARIVDASGEVAAAVEMARRIVPESTALRLRLDDEVPAVRLPPADLEQAVLNLIVNASHAVDGDGVVGIDVKRMVDDDGIAHAHITVSDAGVGIAAEDLDRVCEPFFSTKPPDQGTGLGLSMVHGLAHQSGGSLSISSNLGEGTQIELSFPEASGSASANELEDHIEMKSGTESILLVEDNSVVRRVARSVLERAGYSVYTAKDGVAALDEVKSRPEIMLVITDAIMPRMGGRALYQESRSLRDDLPFLFCTGYSAGTIDAALLDSDDRCDLLLKPWRPAELLSQARKLLDRGLAHLRTQSG